MIIKHEIKVKPHTCGICCYYCEKVNECCNNCLYIATVRCRDCSYFEE